MKRALIFGGLFLLLAGAVRGITQVPGVLRFTGTVAADLPTCTGVTGSYGMVVFDYDVGSLKWCDVDTWKFISPGVSDVSVTAGATVTGKTNFAQVKVNDLYANRLMDNDGGVPLKILGTGLDPGPGQAVRIGSYENWTNIDSKLVSFGVDGGGTWIEKASITSQGLIYSATPFTLVSAYPNVASVASTTLARTRLPNGADQDFTVTAIDIDVGTAGAGGTTNAVYRVTDGTGNCDLSFACNAAAGLKSNSGSSATATLSGTCTFQADDTLTVSVNSIGDCATGPLARNVSVIGNWADNTAP